MTAFFCQKLEVAVLSISLAILSASNDLRTSITDSSNDVVYKVSSKVALTPNKYLFAVN